MVKGVGVRLRDENKLTQKVAAPWFLAIGKTWWVSKGGGGGHRLRDENKLAEKFATSHFIANGQKMVFGEGRQSEEMKISMHKKLLLRDS